MRLPIQIVFHNISGSAWIEELIYENADKLDRFCDQIASCRVVVDMPHRHHHAGNFYHVRIDITVPDKEIIVNRQPREHKAFSDINNALQDAFDSAKRQLENYSQLRKRSEMLNTHAC